MNEEFPSSGSGSEAFPYILMNIQQIQWVAGHSEEYPAAHRLDAYYELGPTGFDATETNEWNWNGSWYEGFEPIGSSPFAPFTGHFDGKKRTINNLYIDREWPASLFGYINGATIKGIRLKDARINIRITPV